MTNDQNSQEKLTLKDLGDRVILENLQPLVSSNPYLAFFIMAGMLEFIARCRYQLKDFQDKEETRKRFVEAINKIDALTAYRIFSFIDDKKTDNNLLYSSIRCGLLHAGIPNEGITLSSEKNDLENNIVGCKDLYEDLKKAWEEIKQDPKTQLYINQKDALYTDGILSGSTETVIEIQK